MISVCLPKGASLIEADNIPDYDPPIQIWIPVVGQKIELCFENDDMEGGFEYDTGTIVQVDPNRQYVLIKRDVADWTVKAMLPLAKNLRLI